MAKRIYSLLPKHYAMRLSDHHGCQMAIARFLELYVFGPSGLWTMAPLHYAAKFDPFLSLDCAPTPSTLAQSKERKGPSFGAIVQKPEGPNTNDLKIWL